MSRTNEWYLVSSRGSILFYIAVNPGCTVAKIADAMSLTQRSVRAIARQLKQAGMITSKTVFRRSHFTVNMDASFSHPTLPEFPLGVILGELVSLPDHGGQVITKVHKVCTILDQLSELATSTCPRPGCDGSLISGADGDTCLLCGRDPSAVQQDVPYGGDRGLGREPQPGGWKRLRA